MFSSRDFALTLTWPDSPYMFLSFSSHHQIAHGFASLQLCVVFPCAHANFPSMCGTEGWTEGGAYLPSPPPPFHPPLQITTTPPAAAVLVSCKHPVCMASQPASGCTGLLPAARPLYSQDECLTMIEAPIAPDTAACRPSCMASTQAGSQPVAVSGAVDSLSLYKHCKKTLA